tara:strand:- start:29 stop:406 length:378 start_codon:yes stop_codon:yes gene_type:complete
MKLGDYLNAINYTKDNLLEDTSAHGGYVPFVINRSLSYFPDTVLQANEMNTQHHLGKREQFDYLRHSIRKRRRFSKWLKKAEDERVESVKLYYGYSTKKALEAMKVLSEEQVDQIHDQMVKMTGS